MSTVGVGIDVCDIARFQESLARTPGLAERLFVGDEVGRPAASLAARFAAKEALAKALGAPAGLAWHDAEVVSLASGQPTFVLRASVAAAAEAKGVTSVHVSLSHDGGLATAYVLLEG
ncbi:holo-ACP synthase [Nocardioides nematodiphilus]|uniref:holo-ACP synthase n=1 Tax=Nocardioides nematodiphilus TaxID=2849669 RepID=UPI001CD997A3|nr:holo-ACP synthase [Nocardioides nematodiphilus]MCA1981305.1 holo-ACP synthase [Nocardioides nematodiphilus]